MLQILGYQISVGDLIVALIFAMFAERFFKVTSKISEKLSDAYAARSRASRLKQISKLEKELVEFNAQISDVQLRNANQIQEFAEIAWLGVTSILLLIIYGISINGLTLNYIFSNLQIKVPVYSQLLTIYTGDNKIVTIIYYTMTQVSIIGSGIYFVMGSFRFTNLRRFVNPEPKLKMLESRIFKLKSKVEPIER